VNRQELRQGFPILAVAIALLAAGSYARGEEPSEADREKTATEARRLNAESVQLYRQGKTAEALEQARAALALRRQLYPLDKYPDGHRELAQSLNNIGSLLQVQRSYAEARPFYEQALAMRRKLYPESKFPDGSPDLAFSLNNLGFLLEVQGQYEKALPYLEQALAMRRKLYPETVYPDGHPELAMSLINLGVLLKEQGSYDRARPFHEQALAMLRKLYPEPKYPDGHPDLASSLNNLGSLLEDHGSYGEARPHLEQALAMRRRLFPKEKFPDGHPDLATSLNNLGCLLEDQGEYDRALPHLEQALAMLRKLYPEDTYPDGHPYLAYSLNNLGSLMEIQGSFEQARKLYVQALNMRRKLYPASKFPNGHPDLAQSLHSLGFLQARGSYDEAKPFLEQSLAMRRNLYPKATYPDGHPELVQSLESFALLDQVIGSNEQARALYEEALDMKRALGRQLLLAASDAEALAAVKVHLLARDGYLSVTGHLPDAAAPAYRALWDSKSALTRALDLKHLTALSTGTKARDQFIHLQEVRRRIDQLRRETRLTPEDRERQLAAFTTEQDQLQKAVATAMPALPLWEERGRWTPDDLVKALPAGTAFIDLAAYTRFERDPQTKGRAGMQLIPSYVAFILAPGRGVRRVELGPVEPIDNVVHSWRRAVDERQTPVSETLRALVWEPLSRQLPPDVKMLYVAPDGDLARLAWAALPLGGGRVLLEQCALATVPHGEFLLRQWRQPRKASVGDSVLTVADVASGERGRSPLPYSRAEAGAVAASAPSEPAAISQADVTEKRVRELLSKSRYAQLGTNCDFRAEEPAEERAREIDALKSWREGVGGGTQRVAVKDPLGYVGLVLAAGRVLPGPALADLPLDGLELVTLSGSETGLGEYTAGDAVTRLQLAFHVGGCPNVVATLWKVNDAASAALLAKFYHEVWKRKKAPIEALREAQLTIYRRPDLVPDLAGERGPQKLSEALAADSADGTAGGSRRADPKLWAAFVLSGSGEKSGD
jgi:tetratricopeptide (TPR) repeat protein/CHAT domain-containing protein